MKAIAIGVAIAALSIGALSIGTAGAQTMQSPAMQSPAQAGPTCLNIDWPYAVDHTKTVDPSTVLFYMKDGKIWQNNLKSPCPGLSFHGFSYVAHEGEICANGPINVIETHETCSLGKFTTYTPPMQHASLTP
jgi:hypothetical protein